MRSLHVEVRIRSDVLSSVSIHDNAPVVIGNRVLIANDVCICPGTHDVHWEDREEVRGKSFALPIFIEDDCWIGAHATILPGVRIGRGATVAAGAVVSKDVEAGCLVGGVPAKFIRKLTRARKNEAHDLVSE